MSKSAKKRASQSPERAQYNSPGQRPGNEYHAKHKALKGRDTPGSSINPTHIVRHKQPDISLRMPGILPGMSLWSDGHAVGRCTQ